MKKIIELIVNGQKQELLVAPNELLLNVLRDRLGLTGAKYGCGIGECGACTVLVDGKPLLACLTLAISMDGREITTIEGITKTGRPARSSAGSLPAKRGRAVRLLHLRDDPDGESFAERESQPHGTGDSGTSPGEHLPLHRLHPDRQRH